MRQRVFVHDYCGHPFQAQLSRRLAARGHEVLHLYSESVLTPQGALALTETDPRTLRFHGIRLDSVIDKADYLRRYLQERTYGRMLARMIREEKPDVVISANTPLDAQAAALRAARAAGAKFVFWLQDVQGIAIEKLLGRRFGAPGRLAGRYYSGIEKRLLRRSDGVVVISEDFAPLLPAWGVRRDAVHVIPNWASMDELPPRPRDNAWAQAHALADRFCFLYSGTLGLKHNPGLLLRLALAYRHRPDICVVVVSEGAAAQWLRERKAELGLDNLRVLPFQPYSALPDMMGSADVLLAILDPDAGTFSVPSKVLSYHCAGRPLLLAVPEANLAARIVRQAQSGIVVDPADLAAFVRKADSLRRAPSERARLGSNALLYAARTFNIERIADRFETLFESLLASAADADRLADEPA